MKFYFTALASCSGGSQGARVVHARGSELRLAITTCTTLRSGLYEYDATGRGAALPVR